MPGETVGFVAEPNCGRGTVDIIWSCMTTIALCTYTVQHPNVPSKPKSMDKQLLHKLRCVLFTLMIPELMSVNALEDFVRCWKHSRRIRNIRGWGAWSLKQSHFLDMGGIEWKEPIDSSNSQTKSTETVSLFPSNDMINERSKTDGVAKTIAICQALWFTTTMIFRLSKHTPLSLLEVLTVSYIFCALIIFICWFKKPCDIQFRIKIEKSLNFPTEIRDYDRNDYRIANTLYYPIFSVFALIFCGIHIAAWNYAFPTFVESLLWRAFSITLFVIPVLVSLISYLRVISKDFDVKWGVIFIMLYVPIRLYLIVASFLAFRSANPAIYTKVGWSSYFGHVGS
ncbi:hypothetical protein V8E54_011103 [Elaphomyces granulatus]|jgi:hypothetical protein